MPIRKLIVKNYSYIPLKVIYIYVFVIYIINALKFVLMYYYPTPFVQKLTGELSKGHIAKVINLSTDYARVIER